MYSIGIIAVAASLKNIMEIAPQMQEQCNVTFLTYTSNDNLVYIYQPVSYTHLNGPRCPQ